jgi:hypothetical protein
MNYYLVSFLKKIFAKIRLFGMKANQEEVKEVNEVIEGNENEKMRN